MSDTNHEVDGVSAYVHALKTFVESSSLSARKAIAQINAISVAMVSARTRYYRLRRQHIAKARGRNWRSVR